MQVACFHALFGARAASEDWERQAAPRAGWAAKSAPAAAKTRRKTQARVVRPSQGSEQGFFQIGEAISQGFLLSRTSTGSQQDGFYCRFHFKRQPWPRQRRQGRALSFLPSRKSKLVVKLQTGNVRHDRRHGTHSLQGGLHRSTVPLNIILAVHMVSFHAPPHKSLSQPVGATQGQQAAPGWEAKRDRRQFLQQCRIKDRDALVETHGEGLNTPSFP
eukprot:1158603-Pelagomonas_calceolata.AAC.8